MRLRFGGCCSSWVRGRRRGWFGVVVLRRIDRDCAARSSETGHVDHPENAMNVRR
jgi:hypothetical protein